MAQFSVKIMRPTGSVLGENQQVDVAGLPQGSDHVHPPVTAAFPAMESAARDFDVAVAGDCFFRFHQAALKGSERV